MQKVRATIPIFLLLAAVRGQGAPEDWGPFGVQQSVVSTSLQTSAHCPAVPAIPVLTGKVLRPTGAAGPWPLVAFLHGGGITNADPYYWLRSHLASKGFVVAAVEYPGACLTQDSAVEAEAMHAVLDAVRAQAAPGSGHVLEGLVDATAPLAAVGHSLGAVGCFFLRGLEPGLQTIVALQPYDDTVSGWTVPCLAVIPSGLAGAFAAAQPIMAGYTGNLYVLTGTEDDHTPPPHGQSWFGLGQPAHAVMATIEGMGHFAFTNEAFLGAFPSHPCPTVVFGSMPPADQHRTGRRFVNAALMAELGGDEDRLYDVGGRGMASLAGNPVWPGIPPIQARCSAPVIWLRLDTGLAACDPAYPAGTGPGCLTVGLAGLGTDFDALVWKNPLSGALEAFPGYPAGLIAPTGVREIDLPYFPDPANPVTVEFLGALYRNGAWIGTRLAPVTL